MIRSHFASAIALAALATAPAFAQTTTSATTGPSAQSRANAAATQRATTGAQGKSTASPRSHDAQVQADAQAAGRTPLCSEFNNPNAGKLADRTTGNAAANSASAVHMDCIPDTAGTGTTIGSTTGTGTVGGMSSGTLSSGTSSSLGGTARGTTSGTGTVNGTTSSSTTMGR